MKIKATETVATPSICYVRGTEYEVDETTARGLLKSGQFTSADSASEKLASEVQKEVAEEKKRLADEEAKKPQRTNLDARTGTPVEDLPAGANKTLDNSDVQIAAKQKGPVEPPHTGKVGSDSPAEIAAANAPGAPVAVASRTTATKAAPIVTPAKGKGGK